MVSTAAQVRGYSGPVILSFGFRPFFLGGAIWAAFAIAIWLPVRSGAVELPSAFSPVQWHVHELLFGYLPAIIAGFLLTAVPNWTGRLPVVGKPLLILFLMWFAGRLAILFSGALGMWVAAVVDLSFLVLLAAVIAREIVAGGNTRNLKVLGVVGLLLVGNLIFHIESIADYDGGYGVRTGIAAAVLLITLIGGRVIPSFTRNWLVQNKEGRLPVPFSKFDGVTVGLSVLALSVWILFPEHRVSAVLCAVAGLAHFLRMGRWAGDRTTGQPLVFILHVGYLFVPVGFILVAVQTFVPGILVQSGAVHAWTTGAIGLMTLAIMTRATLGHTGNALVATPAIALIYVFAFLAALTRLVAAFDFAPSLMLQVSALTWFLAFAWFVVVFGPLLVRTRR